MADLRNGGPKSFSQSTSQHAGMLMSLQCSASLTNRKLHNVPKVAGPLLCFDDMKNI